jgi:ornithine carbamoyltransferase
MISEMASDTKHFIDISDISLKDIVNILDLSANIKAKKISPKNLIGKNIAMIFEKSSTRTRASFESGINQLNANAIIMNANDMHLSKGEEVSDTSKVLSRYVDGVIIRSKLHKTLNALSDFSHPCQIIASIFTIIEKLGSINNKKLTWFGEPNNVLNSYIHISAILNFELTISVPPEMKFCDQEIAKAQNKGAKIQIISDPIEAAKNTDVLITDTWFSMGDASWQNNNLRQKKIDLLMPYQINQEKMNLAKSNAIFTHCLPVYRGYEATKEVVDSKRSVIFDEAENRLHAQKAILTWLYS